MRWDPEKIKPGGCGNTDVGEGHTDCGRWEARSQEQARQEAITAAVLSVLLPDTCAIQLTLSLGINIVYQEALRMLGPHTNPMLSHCSFQVCAQLKAEATSTSDM